MTPMPASPFLNSSVISPRTEVSTADSECRLQNVARPDATAERDPHPISSSAPVATPAADTAATNLCVERSVAAEAISHSGRTTPESAVVSKPPPVADATAAPIHSSDDGVESRHTDEKPSQKAARPSQTKATGASQVADGPTRDRAVSKSVAGVAPSPSGAIPTTMEVPEEASALAPTKNPDADALGTEFIHEIFAGAAKIDDYRFDAEFDQHAFLYAIEEGEELPLFIREADGYLKRQA